MDTAARNVKVGITTDELDRIVHEVHCNILNVSHNSWYQTGRQLSPALHIVVSGSVVTHPEWVAK